GISGSAQQIVYALSYFQVITDNALGGNAEYRVANWPETPQGKRWREITQERDVAYDRVALEPVFPWEAKVYALVDA
ncbi:MAG: hypothetical protein JZU70_07210, partial [Chlorobium sp.]|nr:hypothetical protein [Chlorobium sp.]